MATIDVLTVIDPIGFADNNLPLTTPIDNIPMVSTSLLNTNVRMIGETGSINYGQATWNLGINVRRGDTVRWWDTTVVQGSNEDMIIIGFKKYTDWDSIMGTATADAMGVGMAYIQSGFTIDNFSNLKFAMNSFQNNYIQAKVLDNAQIGKTVSYYLVVAKLDVSHVGTPILKGLYRFDPNITVIA